MVSQNQSKRMTQQSMEERFDREFATLYLISDASVIDDVSKRLKQFISQEIERARQDERINERNRLLDKLIEGLETAVPYTDRDKKTISNLMAIFNNIKNDVYSDI